MGLELFCKTDTIKGLPGTSDLIELLNKNNVDVLTIDDIINENQRTKFETYQTYNYLVLNNDIVGLDIIFSSTFIYVYCRHGQIYEYKKLYDKYVNETKNIKILWEFIRLYITTSNNLLTYMDESLKELEETIIGESKYHAKNIHNSKKNIETNIILYEDFYYAMKSLHSEYKSKYTMDLLDHSIRIKNRLERMNQLCYFLISMDRDNADSKTNEINKILTMIATAFVPPTFLCSIYGMNFTNMFELQFKYGYISFWILIIVWGFMVVGYFRKKEWI